MVLVSQSQGTQECIAFTLRKLAQADTLFQQLYAWTDKMKYIIAILILFQSILLTYAADSVDQTSPSMSDNIVVSGSGCPRAFEEGVSATGVMLFCLGGLWRESGANGFVEVKEVRIRTPADNNTTVIVIATCPATKRVVGGSCNFQGGTTQHKKPLAHPVDANNSMWCFFALANAYDPLYPGGLENALVTTAHCVDAS